jgi:hypothetical protein
VDSVQGRTNARARASKSRVVREVKVLAGVGAVAAAVAQSAGATGWAIQPVPDPAHSSDSDLSGVSCASTRDCVAVGFRDLPVTDDPLPLVEHWNGSTWSAEHTPASNAAGWSAWLSAVSCPSKSACLAVGLSYSDDSSPGPLVERWDGSSWSIERTTDLGNGEALDGVSCASSIDCMAVGFGRSTAAAHWNGTRWRAQDLHFGDPGGRPNALTSVSCMPGMCAAVGWDNVGSCGGDHEFYSLAVLGFWTEQRWSLRRHPNLACSNGGGDPGGYVMNGISCASPVTCTAVGDGVYRWDGRRWSIQAAPIGSGTLDGVSCPSTDACTAVGSGVYTWNGRRWSGEGIPLPANATGPELTGVSCPSRASCVAVGSSIDSFVTVHPLVESIGMGATPANRQANATSER